MKPGQPQQPEVDAEAVRRYTRKILASPEFCGSERMCRFLRFAVERALDGRGGELKEYLVGVEIFDRDESFDPRVDPIVRVEARRLRAKLKSYYEKEGREDSLRIELPTGGYTPRFCPRQEEAPPAPAAPGTIAVLPFVNLSPEPENEYFSDGLTEELIHALTKLEGLRVVAWNSAAKMKGREEDIPSVGRQLNVGSVLVGSVRRSGGRLRVTVRLIETCTGFHLWSETYDRQIEDLFAIQEEISRAIVDNLRIKLIQPSADRPIARSPSNLEAYNLYLKGRFHWNKRTREGLERAIRYFREALAIEPKFAAGYAGLADAFTLLADHGLAPPTVMSQAKAAALQALDLDPELGEAHTSLALILSHNEWQWAEAGAHYRRAIELSPGYVTAHHWYSCDYLALLGRMDEAVAESKLAIELDPLSCVMTESLAYVLLLARRFDESLEQLRKVTELEPYFYKGYTHAGRIYIQTGRYTEAIEMLERGRALAGDLPTVLGALGQAHALAGNTDEARAILVNLAGRARTGHVPSTTFALLYLGLGDKDRSLACLEAGCERHEPTVAALKVHPAYDALRNEPRFAALIRRIGLAD